jgi:N-acetylmuramoyl-L-alanine amidase
MHHRTARRARGPAERPLWWWRQRLLGALILAVMAVLAQSPGGAGAAVWSSAQRVAEGNPVDTKVFQPGACMEYAPTSGNRHLTVFLDAGHGGLDPGGVGETESGQTIEEADMTLPVELDAMGLLRAKGFTVVVSRTKDETVARFGPGDVSGGLFTAQGEHDDVAARDVCANTAKANVLVGIYFDAGGSSLDAGSVTGYDTERPFSAQNLKLATLVQTDVLDAMNAQGWGIPDLGVVDDSELGGPALTTAAADYDHLLLLGPADPGYDATPSGMPGALIEPLFITDPYEGSIADSASGQEVIAGGLAQAIERYFAPPATTGQKAQAARPTS